MVQLETAFRKARCVAAIATIALSSVPAMAETLHVGVFIHYPLVMQTAQEGEAYGPGIDYAKEVARALGYDAQIEVLPIPRILSYLKDGSIDMSLELGKTDERTVFILYPDEPALVAHPSLTFRANQPIQKISARSDLAGMRVGYLLGAFTGSFFEGDHNIAFDLISGDAWIQQNMGKLLSGRIDAILDQNDYSCLAEARRQGLEKKIKIIRLPVDGVLSYVVFSKKSRNGEALLKAYNDKNGSSLPSESEMIERFLESIKR